MNREAWLKAADKEIRKLFSGHGIVVPKVRVSIGFPSGGIRAGVVAECWSRNASSDNVNQIFLSPVLVDTTEVLATLVHEYVHAVLDTEFGHDHRFQKIARLLGLTSPWVNVNISGELQADLKLIQKKIGRFNSPEFVGDLVSGSGSRLLKVQCPVCGYTARITKKWLAIGEPTCVCGTRMVTERR